MTHGKGNSNNSGQTGGGGYTYKGSGINSQGNSWDSRDYGSSAPNQNTYHYSNKDGSYHYSNPNGSTYHNNGNGGSKYTSPSGQSYTKK